MREAERVYYFNHEGYLRSPIPLLTTPLILEFNTIIQIFHILNNFLIVWSDLGTMNTSKNTWKILEKLNLDIKSPSRRVLRHNLHDLPLASLYIYMLWLSVAIMFIYFHLLY